MPGTLDVTNLSGEYAQFQVEKCKVVNLPNDEIKLVSDPQGKSYKGENIIKLIKYIREKKEREESIPTELFFPEGGYYFEESIIVNVEGLILRGERIGRDQKEGGTHLYFTKKLTVKTGDPVTGEPLWISDIEKDYPNANNNTPDDIGPTDNSNMYYRVKYTIRNLEPSQNDKAKKGCIDIRSKHVTITNFTITQKHNRPHKSYVYPPAIWGRHYSEQQVKDGKLVVDNQNNPVMDRYASEYCHIENIYFLNTFYGIRVDSGNAMISCIYGHPIFRGIHLHRPGSSDPMHVSHIHFKRTDGDDDPQFRTLSGFFGQAFYFTGCEHTMISDVFALGYAYGFYFSSGKNVKLHITNVDFDSCRFAIRAHKDSHGSAQISNLTARCGGKWNANRDQIGSRREEHDRSNAMGIFIESNADDENKKKGFNMQFYNLMILQPYETGINVSGPSYLMIENLGMFCWGINPKTQDRELQSSLVAKSGATIQVGNNRFVTDIHVIQEHRTETGGRILGKLNYEKALSSVASSSSPVTHSGIQGGKASGVDKNINGQGKRQFNFRISKL